MSVFRRLGNVARGKMLEWQRRATSPDADQVLAEEPVRRPRPPRDDDEDEDDEPLPPPSEPVEGTPAKPKKRRL